MIKISVLIPTIPSRVKTFFPSIIESLSLQARNLPVEILGLLDNKLRTIGEKRNELIKLAKGEFIIFVDDDDRVSSDFIDTLLQLVAQNPDADCVVYDTLCSINGSEPRLCKYGIEYDYIETKELWTGKPSHTMLWKADIARMVKFPEQNLGEDSAWAKEASRYIHNQVRCDKVLYYYDFNYGTTETRDYVENLVYSTEPEKIECSIALSTRNKDKILQRTLNSIFKQKPGFNFEVIVVNDGGDLDLTENVCYNFINTGFPLKYIKLNNKVYRNPSIARNIAYQLARGRVLIMQSDDVIHVTSDTIERLCLLEEKTFNISTVYNVTFDDKDQMCSIVDVYTGIKNPRPLFFLGSILRKYIFKIGGNCEEFDQPGFEDDFLGCCLMSGLKLQPNFRDDIIGWHQDHPRPNLVEFYDKMQRLYNKKVADAIRTGVWVGGKQWNYIE